MNKLKIQANQKSVQPTNMRRSPKRRLSWSFEALREGGRRLSQTSATSS